MPGKTYPGEMNVRQNTIIDVLLIIIFSLFLLISGKASADMLAGGLEREFQKMWCREKP